MKGWKLTWEVMDFIRFKAVRGHHGLGSLLDRGREVGGIVDGMVEK